MDACVMCRRNVQQAENWIKCHLWGGFAIFHWRCFGEYLNRERTTGRERGMGGAATARERKCLKNPHFLRTKRSKCHVFESSNGDWKSGRRSRV